MTQRMKITYATMSADNEELQSAFDRAIDRVISTWLGVDLPMFIDGRRVSSDHVGQKFSPMDTTLHLCNFAHGTAEDARRAIAAAKRAFPEWRRVPWQERVALIRKLAERISENSLELAALMILEVGKSRLEALGEVEETADLFRYYANSMEKNHGFIHELGKLNPDDPHERNFSVLRPYGVWAVISPFNFPMALSAAPIAAALLTGNTVVFKGSSETPYTSWKVAELFAEAGLPPGVFNALSGPGGTVGQELQDNPDICGWTFTGSYQVGMQLYRKAASGVYPRFAIIEMGGKNPVIVSNTADVTKAATGVVRAAFGLSGQKCSACSRVYVQKGIYDAFKTKLVEMTRALKVGVPTHRDVFMGSVINRAAYENYQRYGALARRDGTVLVGGRVLTEGPLARGYYVEPTIVEGLPEDHELVKTELFLPILHLARVETLHEAMDKANDTIYGLTAGFFGEDPAEIEWFFENIEAGTTYVNRAAGATTGAWPGVQAFGGWKGSGSSGKGIGGLYTLALYMHEQSRTIMG
ncbi:MAG: 1-pyrroline-5-carboxylate dehydrogenase [Ardenticatenia bacterium]|nr:MAG: 1-pyrroline-5-carboxylate dehydrogenase [Ardenticatenia bacterium]